MTDRQKPVSCETDPVKGRGSTNRQESRYIRLRHEPVDDGWFMQDEPGKIRTQTFADRTKRLVTHNRSPDIPFSQSVNAYKGCEHGCIYCFARPTHAYLDLSPGLDFETKIFFKTNVRKSLLQEFSRPPYQCSTLAMGTNTDPYQPLEKTKRITREVLSTLLELRHPASIVTKSALILRDLDILTPMAQLGLIHVNVSVTTLSIELKTKLEPRTASPGARLRTISTLREAGVPTGAMVAPIIPFINDEEIEQLVSACASAGAQRISYILVRLPMEVHPLFEEWLAQHYPLKAARVMSAIYSTRGGKAYRSGWHERMVGEGPIAMMVRRRFNQARKQHGLDGAELPPLNTHLFIRPNSPQDRQMALF